MKFGKKFLYEGVLALPERQVGTYAIRHIRRPAGEKLVRASMRTAMMAGHKLPPVSYDHETVWHELSYDGGVWMTDLPIEQGQIDALLTPIRTGSVLVGGLGIGYAATILARRPLVKRVVVIEKAPEVIALVRRPLLEHLGDDAAKVVIVEGDLFKYLRDEPRGFVPFDWAFYDVWQSDGEGTFHRQVVPLHVWSKGKVRRRPIMWNEDVMRGQLFHSLQSRSLTYSQPDFAKGLKGWPSLDFLAEVHGDMWLDWSQPFFAWVKRTRPGPDRLTELSKYYAGLYGTPEFPTQWAMLSGEEAA